MESYFAAASEALGRHGGTVEKFVGDAVMAIFGVPVAHEDDALRACRAVLEIVSEVDVVDRRVAHAHGVRLEVRIGVETGEVVMGDPARGSTFASGSPVNIAARLQQQAGPGECVLGAQCHRLVRDLVDAEARPGVTLKGIAAPVTAYNLLGIKESRRSDERRFESPLVGRSEELARLRKTFRLAVTHRTCRLLTVLGPAGSGKSRLVEEFVGALPGVRENTDPLVVLGF
jgi:class 3 adenylate cyclase